LGESKMYEPSPEKQKEMASKGMVWCSVHKRWTSNTSVEAMNKRIAEVEKEYAEYQQLKQAEEQKKIKAEEKLVELFKTSKEFKEAYERAIQQPKPQETNKPLFWNPKTKKFE